jgi:hypothetical protein
MANIQLQKIELDSTQKQIINDFADIFHEQSDLSLTMLKGFLWKSLREWQSKNKMTIEETEKGSGSSPTERIQQAKEILGIFKDHLKESTNIDNHAIELSLRKAIRHYTFTYANR